MDVTTECPCGWDFTATPDNCPSDQSVSSYAAFKGAQHQEYCPKGHRISFQFGEPSEMEKQMTNVSPPPRL